MNSSTTNTTANTSIPITKMVNDLFLQWLSLPDTRTTLHTALQSVRNHSKMPDHINYPKSYTTRGGGFSKQQHFDSPPVSPVPRAASSPRNGLSSISSTGEFTPGLSGYGDERKQRSLKKKYPVLNDSTSALNASITSSSVDQQQISGGKISPPQIAKSEPVPSSPSTNVIPNRTSTTTTPSDGAISKPAQQTPIVQTNTQSPSTTIRELSPTPSSPKPTTSGVASLREQFDSIEQSPSITATKTPTRAKSPVSVSVPTESVIRPSITPIKPVPSVKETSPIPTSVIQPEGTPKSVVDIPKFYFPNGKTTTPSSIESLINKQLNQANEDLFQPKHDKLHLEDFGKLAQLIDLSLYWKAPLFRACVQDSLGSKTTITPTTTVSYSQFDSFWKKICQTHHDNASKFVQILALSSPSSTLPATRSYLTVDDWDYLIQDIIDTHPGLKFLREAREFHSRYIKTVIARIYYNCNRSWSGKLTVQELRRSNFLSILDRIEEEEDINRIHDYFSYEHFYVIYCKFWELDSDHDLLISRDDLTKHNNGAISNKMIDRIFSGAVSNSENMKEGKMSYYEFVWFLMSEEDKRSPTSIEYWFRCMDLDGDGILSMFELDYFYQEQVHKMEIYGIEYMPFEDCICQMLDLVKPEEDNKIRLKDLKRCKLTNVFFDTFFNLEKYLDNEQKDPFSNIKDPESPDVSDWVKFAEAEYDNLTHEDGANDNLDDVNYDEDFEEEDDANGALIIEQSANKRMGSNSVVSPPQRLASNTKITDSDERWKD
ncbi:unnamed protein product [Adineta ricciae]|uniref:EF-hand domain-containing protein n=1 Tax=Adineta ricciae TaxID=249248 RepID=A0A813SVB7_ADIRI|nr:unnamed protein product [Adineta ricciae]